jgi:hypothetical protein
MKRKILLVLFIAIASAGNIYAQASRGPTPGELYIAFPWFVDNNTGLHHAMLAYTNNKGRNLQALYTSVENSGEMQVGTILADARPNVLYNRDSEGLHRSFDNGQTWEFLEEQINATEFNSGNVTNEIFKKTQGIIYKSVNNGDNWTSMHTEIVEGGIEVGNQQGELYGFMGRLEYDTVWYYDMELKYSINDGAEFDTYPIAREYLGSSSSVGPKFSRGTTIGELYLVTWWLGPKYRIYRSIDHGHSFNMQYEQPENAYMWDEMFAFTAGRGECEFYAFKLKTYVDGYYFRLHVYHSADCAQTFTEYIHELTPDYDGNPAQIIYTIAAAANPLEGGDVAGAGYYHEGEEVNLSATPNEGYNFKNWTENGSPISDEPELNFTADSTRTLKANFQLINSVANPEISSISIYPNPTNGLITLSFQQFHKYNDVLFEVLSMDGRKLLSKPLQSEISTHDISNLPTGMYLYRFTGDGLMIKTGKLIIN